MIEKIPAPDPGVYEGVSFDVYRSWDAVNNSSMGAAAKSAAHWRDQPTVEVTDAIRMGSLIHAGKFEPFSLVEQYAVMPVSQFVGETIEESGCSPRGAKRTKVYEAKVEAWRSENQGKEEVTDLELEELKGIVGSLAAHRRAGEYFGAGQCELSIVWRDVETGLLCKARLDHWSPAAGRVTDLKSTDDISEFERKIANWGHHRQVAFYGDGMQALGFPVAERCIVAVERIKPYGVKAAPVCATDIVDGRAEYRQLLRVIAAAKETGAYGSYEDPDEWRRPVWKQQPRRVVVEGEIINL
jgi:hypothetical protein